ASRTAGTASSLLGENNFASSTFANGTHHAAQHSDHFVVGWVERTVMLHQELAHHEEDNASADHATKDRNQKRNGGQPTRVARQQIADSAEPRHERGAGAEIDRREVRAGAMRTTGVRSLRRMWDMHMSMTEVDMQVRQMQMQAAEQE